MTVGGCATNPVHSHLAPGPQDNAGKDPRRAMDRHVVNERKDNVTTSEVDAFSYSACLRWCRKYMAKPDDNHEHRGTWGANGAYFWDGRSNGTDPNPLRVPVLDLTPVGFQPVEGSNELYSFRAWNNHPSQPELECMFVPCYCCDCRAARHEKCSYRSISGGFMYVQVPQVRAAPRRRLRRRGRGGRGGGAADRDSDTSDDE